MKSQTQTTFDSTFDQHLNTGRPLGDDSFIEKIEIFFGRDLKKKKPGSKADEN